MMRVMTACRVRLHAFGVTVRNRFGVLRKRQAHRYRPVEGMSAAGAGRRSGTAESPRSSFQRTVAI